MDKRIQHRRQIVLIGHQAQLARKLNEVRERLAELQEFCIDPAAIKKYDDFWDGAVRGLTSGSFNDLELSKLMEAISRINLALVRSLGETHGKLVGEIAKAIKEHHRGLEKLRAEIDRSMPPTR